MSDMTFTPDLSSKVLTVERTFAAPADKVWQAWTTPELFEKWFGPRGWTTAVKHMEFVPEGYLLYAMKCEDPAQTDWYGQESCGKSVYTLIDEPNSFSYTDYFSDSDGNVDPNMPKMDITVEFVPVDGGTRVVSRAQFDSAEDLQKVLTMGMEPGLTQTWDRLEEFLSADK